MCTVPATETLSEPEKILLPQPKRESLKPGLSQNYPKGLRFKVKGLGVRLRVQCLRLRVWGFNA